MSLQPSDLKAKIGSELETDTATLVAGSCASEIRDLLVKRGVLVVRALLGRLMRHAIQDQYVYRHQWQMGDLVLWDNTGTMHRVRPYDADSGRQLHRFTLNGEEPITAAA